MAGLVDLKQTYLEREGIKRGGQYIVNDKKNIPPQTKGDRTNTLVNFGILAKL